MRSPETGSKKIRKSLPDLSYLWRVVDIVVVVVVVVVGGDGSVGWIGGLDGGPGGSGGGGGCGYGGARDMSWREVLEVLEEVVTSDERERLEIIAHFLPVFSVPTEHRNSICYL